MFVFKIYIGLFNYILPKLQNKTDFAVVKIIFEGTQHIYTYI